MANNIGAAIHVTRLLKFKTKFHLNILVGAHPLRGRHTHPIIIHPSQHQSHIVKEYIKKIPTFIAFCKLLLGHVKVETL